MRFACLVSVVALLVSAGAAAQNLPPSSVDEIIAGAKSCAAATTQAGVNATTLEADGWHKASVSDHGKALDAPMTFYGKGHLLMMFDKSGTHPICFVTARIASKSDFTKLQAAFTSAYGAPVKDNGNGEQIFMAPDHRMYDLASTGQQGEPAVRVVVGASHPEVQ